MKQFKFFLFFIFIILIASAVNGFGESSNYTLGGFQNPISSGIGESESYTFVSTINYQQPIDSGASTTTYIFGQSTHSNEPEDDPPYEGSSGGGGGNRAIIKVMDFDAYPEVLKYFIKTGQEKEKIITIENKGNESIIVELRESAGFIGVNEKSLDIPAYSIKTITLLVSAMNERPGIYSSQVTLTSGSVSKQITLLVEIEDTNSPLDIIVDVIEEDKIITNPTNISANLIIYDLQGNMELDVEIDYFVQDLDGNILIHELETKKINSGENINKIISLPDGLPVGDYILSVKTTYKGQKTFSGSIFKVVDSNSNKNQTVYSELISDFEQGLIFLYIGLGIVAVFLLFFYYEHNKILLMVIWTKHLLKKQDIYHAKLMFNKIAKVFSEIKFEGARKDELKIKIKHLYHQINSKNS